VSGARPGPPGTAVVIGAGIAGLGTAALLAREGYQVTVLEGRDEVGGRAGLWEHDGFRFDTGPSWYLMPEVFDHFFRLLGTSAEDELDLVRLDPGYRVFFQDNGSVEVPTGREEAMALFESLEPGAGRRLAHYLDSASDTYAMALRHFLYTTYASLLPLANPAVLKRLPRLVQLLGRSLEAHVAARFADPRLRQVLGYPAVFLGSSPRLAPSMYHLMSHLDLTDGVLYPMGGFSEVIAAVRAVAEREGVTILTGSPVASITTEPTPGRRPGAGARARARARATGVTYRDADDALHALAADVVVSAADLHHTETELLPAALRSRSAGWWRRQVAGPSAVLVYLGVDGSLPELEHHSLFFTEHWQEGFDRIFAEPAGRTVPFPDEVSLYVCRPSATDPSVAPAGTENLFVLVPVPPDPALGKGGHDGGGDAWVEAVADAAIAQVARWAGIPDLAERVVLRRTVGPADFAADLNAWSGTALGPAHTLGQSAMFRVGNTSRRVAGLFYAGGSTIPGIGLPMCLISAELVVKRLRGDTSTGPLREPLGARRASSAPVEALSPAERG
jgi:phytoene desaturase